MPSNGLSELVKRMGETGIRCRNNGQRETGIGCRDNGRRIPDDIRKNKKKGAGNPIALKKKKTTDKPLSGLSLLTVILTSIEHLTNN